MAAVPDLNAATWERMIRAVEKVRERLSRAVAALEAAGVPYAVVGGNAVANWVATVDEGAVRNTPNVDLLVRRPDTEQVHSALNRVGFLHVSQGDRPVVFLDGPDGDTRQAVRVWFSRDRVTPESEPFPDVERGLPTLTFRVVSLPVLVRMKLGAFRTIDRVHVQDLVRVGLIDHTWPDRFPPELAQRLRAILANPDG